jgi:hypothetical protein
LGKSFTQLPALQYVPAAHSALAVQLSLQLPLVQATRHPAEPLQLSPVAPPQRWSLPQTPDLHSLAFEQTLPFATWPTQLPAWQKVAAPHSLSTVQGEPQCPLTHAPERHASPLVHDSPVAAPQRPSLAHTPPRHSAFVAQVVPVGRPQCWSAPKQTAPRQSAPDVQAPVVEPHLPSASQTPERQAALLEQVLPLSTPHRPSGPQAPPRHCAWAVQAASLGWPQRLS